MYNITRIYTTGRQRTLLGLYRLGRYKIKVSPALFGQLLNPLDASLESNLESSLPPLGSESLSLEPRPLVKLLKIEIGSDFVLY